MAHPWIFLVLALAFPIWGLAALAEAPSTTPPSAAARQFYNSSTDELVEDRLTTPSQPPIFNALLTGGAADLTLFQSSATVAQALEGELDSPLLSLLPKTPSADRRPSSPSSLSFRCCLADGGSMSSSLDTGFTQGSRTCCTALPLRRLRSLFSLFIFLLSLIVVTVN